MCIKLWGMYWIFKEPPPSGVGLIATLHQFLPRSLGKVAPSKKSLVRNPSLNWLLVTGNVRGLTRKKDLSRPAMQAPPATGHFLGRLSKSEVIPVLVVQTKNRYYRCFQLRSKQEHLHQRGVARCVQSICMEKIISIYYRDLLYEYTLYIYHHL